MCRNVDIPTTLKTLYFTMTETWFYKQVARWGKTNLTQPPDKGNIHDIFFRKQNIFSEFDSPGPLKRILC